MVPGSAPANDAVPFPEQVEMLRKCFIKKEKGGGITSGLIDMIIPIKYALLSQCIWGGGLRGETEGKVGSGAKGNCLGVK